jgi:UPF0716 protein FxsA
MADNIMPLITFVLLCAEIALLIKFAQAVGGGIVLLEILGTAALGVLLFRMAGRSVFEPARVIELMTRRPTRDLINSLGLLFLGGLLLLIPGLLSDAVGIVLVVRFLLQGGRPSRERATDPNAIDVEFQVHDEPPSE